MTARCQMEQVQSGYAEKSNSGEVSEGLGDSLVFLVNDQRSFPHGVATVPDFTNTSPHLKIKERLHNENGFQAKYRHNIFQ